MEEQQILKTTGGRRPPLAAFSIIEKPGHDRPVWHKVGVGWVNRDGSINVQFDSLPLGGRVQLREERERGVADPHRPQESVRPEPPHSALPGGRAVTIRAVVTPNAAPIPSFVALRWSRGSTRWLWVALAALCLWATPALARDAKKRSQKPAMEGVLNVNRASEAELRLLPGIGKGRAQAIVARRAQRPFANVDEVARLKGMRGVVQKLRRHLVVEGATTLRPAPRGASPPVAGG